MTQSVLVQGERSVDELAGQIGQSTANTSQHRQVLARAGLVGSRRDGNPVLYQFALLVLINALVGATVGQERTVVPLLAEDVFGPEAYTAMLSFIAVFGTVLGQGR